MIKRLRISNYRSLREIELEPRQRNVLVGANMSGKSNFVDCLSFLTQIANFGLIKAFNDRLGFSTVVWNGKPEDHTISISLSLEGLDQDTSRGLYTYQISILGSRNDFVSIARERITLERNGQTFVLGDVENGRGVVQRIDGTNISDRTGGPSASLLELSIPGWEGMQVKEYMMSWQFYHLASEAMRQANPAVEQRFLLERGDNLSGWLMTLATRYPDEFARFQQAAADALPDLEQLLTPPTQAGTTFLLSREKHLRNPLSVWQMADGELMFLALLSLIFVPLERGAPLVCVEEPETHLHPRLMDTLVELLTQVQAELGKDAAQVFITTHSPHLVDRVNLDDLLVFEKRDGATHCVRPGSKQHLKDLLSNEEIGLGELWYSGALGGV